MKVILSWMFYYFGDFACWILELNHENEKWTDFWFPLYQFNMNVSVTLQGTHPKGPWIIPEEVPKF